MVTIKPLENRVLVRRSKAKQSKGGIFIPDSAQEKPREGEVVEIGPGKHNEKGTLEPMTVKKGDRVMFGPYSGTDVKVQENEEDEYLILSEEDLLGILSE